MTSKQLQVDYSIWNNAYENQLYVMLEIVNEVLHENNLVVNKRKDSILKSLSYLVYNKSSKHISKYHD